MTEPSDDLVNCWPLYVTDDDRVTCHESPCPQAGIGQFIGYGRRRTFGEIRQDLIDHIKLAHRD